MRSTHYARFKRHISQADFRRTIAAVSPCELLGDWDESSAAQVFGERLDEIVPKV